MFDLSRLTDALSGFLGGSAAEHGLGSALSEAGIDIGQLQGLAPDQIMDVLGQNGIDLGSFAPEEVQQLMGGFGGEGGLDALAGEWFGGEGPEQEG